MCKKCNSSYQKEYYAAHKLDYYTKNKVKRLRNREFLQEYKKARECCVCGESRWYILEFHHRNPSTKSFNIARSVSGYSLKRLKQEVAKCDVMCANCHNAHHYERGLKDEHEG